MPSFNIIDPLVWKLLISPYDRTIKKKEFDLILSNVSLPVKLYEPILEEKVILGRKWKKKHLTRYLIIRGPRSNINIKNRKLIIIFPGRNFNFFQRSNTKYFERFYKTNKLDDHDMAVIVYPKKVYNIDFLTKSCSIALAQIFQHGYKFENVSIMGWCLGGYIASESIKKYMESNNISPDDKFKCYINNKSFAGLNDFLYFILPDMLRPILKIWIVKKHVRVWEHDAADSFRKIESNFENCYVIFSQHDNIVKGLSHLYKHLDDLKEKIHIREDTDHSSHHPNWHLLAELFTETDEILQNS
ncbi:unnamed protein product [Brachionus calyciflorus]|uniref:Alpha/beta hydrolase n=1 Tax=Brachionus calyciflorus TaxID=104777 RepID=A0A814E3J9_9BILA|nr:unnamed protein product [Brachionus calyciflorus]